ncbi:GNAT family N-acetyltransferase [Actinopolymorpha singaporensis]|uniref:GNAT family N-acetyltransferase n=1 Tax=Actinopolymorpha singaporensis TaxID=117157 RepID=UPI0012FE1D70
MTLLSSVPGGLLQCLWRELGQWSPGSWTLTLVTVVAGQAVGLQRLFAVQFLVRREVANGSWLTADSRGKGIGTEMRAAVLQLSFAGLGATYARSDAQEGNAASIAVSRKLGYAGQLNPEVSPPRLPTAHRRRAPAP